MDCHLKLNLQFQVLIKILFFVGNPVTNLNSKRFSKALNDGKKGVGGEHGSFIGLSVDNLGQGRVAGWQPSLKQVLFI